jgi:DNA-binding transcriptional regulator YiaG
MPQNQIDTPIPQTWPNKFGKSAKDCLNMMLRETGITQRHAARVLNVDERTLRRWVSESDLVQPPWAGLELLRRMHIKGELRIS